MTSDVVLTAALRQNLLSLQDTQRLIDDTQLRLATGLRVNSALDNPQNFFTSQSLNNRASDLGRLLDGIGQSIRTIEAADDGVTALTSLLDQASSVVQSARDELASTEGEARLVGTVDLSATADLTGLAAIDAADQFSIFTTDDAGNQISQEITINAGDTAASLAAQITNAFADNQNGEITAEVTSDGFLAIQSEGGRTFQIRDDVNAANLVTLAGFAALGLDQFFEDATRGAATAAQATIIGGTTATSISLFEAPGDLVEAGDVLVGTYQDSDGNTVFNGFAAGDTISIVVDNGGAPITASLTGAEFTATSTFQDLVDEINEDTNVNSLVQLGFDSGTGQLSITALADSVENVQLVYTAAGVTDFAIGLGDPGGNLDPLLAQAAGTYDTVLSFNSSTETLDSLASDYNNLRTQIDRLVVDASFRGVNLLNGDSLTTFFNEDNTSTLVTTGATFTSAGLGITEATFRSSTEVELSNTQARDALNEVRAFGSSLANNLSIIQTRRDFTENIVNTLTAGADDLVVADQNEEGANLLALQTRQALGVTSLSLASQSQQSVLRLF